MLKRTPLRKVNPEVAKKRKYLKENQREEDEKFYEEIWDERMHKSDLTKHYLGFEMKTIYFHHLLAKHPHPEYRHCKWNILLCEDYLHNQIETNENLLPDDIKQIYFQKMEEARIKAHLISL